MAAKDYVWGVKGINKMANQYKLTTVAVKQLIKEEVQAVLDEKKTKVSKKRVSKKIAILMEKRKKRAGFTLLKEVVYKKGMKDPSIGAKTGPIAKIQQKLIDLGHLSKIPDSEYGFYGLKTKAAVRTFQTAQVKAGKLPRINPKTKRTNIDGVVGDITNTLLFSVEYSAKPAVPKPISTKEDPKARPRADAHIKCDSGMPAYNVTNGSCYPRNKCPTGTQVNKSPKGLVCVKKKGAEEKNYADKFAAWILDLAEQKKQITKEAIGIPGTDYEISGPKEWLTWLAPDTTKKIKKWAYNRYTKQIEIPLVGELENQFGRDLANIIKRTGRDRDDRQALHKEKMRWAAIKNLIQSQDPSGKQWKNFFDQFIKKYYNTFSAGEKQAANMLLGFSDSEKRSGLKTMKRLSRVKKQIGKEELGEATPQDFKTGYLLFNQNKNRLFWMSRKDKILKCWTAVSGHPEHFDKIFPDAEKIQKAAHVVSPTKEDHKKLLNLFSKFKSAMVQKAKGFGPTPKGIYIAQNFQRKPYPWKNWKAAIQHLLAGGYSELDIGEEERKNLNKALVKIGLLNPRSVGKTGSKKYGRPSTTLGYQGHKQWSVGKAGIGAAGWGFHRIWLVPAKGTKTHGRNGFTIHGGSNYASSGCIDLSADMPDFVRYWEKFKGTKGKMKVVVRYDDFPEGRCPS